MKITIIEKTETDLAAFYNTWSRNESDLLFGAYSHMGLLTQKSQTQHRKSCHN